MKIDALDETAVLILKCHGHEFAFPFVNLDCENLTLKI